MPEKPSIREADAEKSITHDRPDPKTPPPSERPVQPTTEESKPPENTSQPSDQ